MIRIKVVFLALTIWLWLQLVVLFAGCGQSNHSPDASNLDALAEIASLHRPYGISNATWTTMKDRLSREVSLISIAYGPPDDPGSVVTDISASDNGALLLTWAYTSTGDYDQNGEVNAADLTPMAPALLKGSVDPLWLRWSLSDGDRNGEVNIADITPIGANFRQSVEGYQIQYSSASSDGPFVPAGDVAFAASAIPNGQYRKRFSYSDPLAESGWYRVVPYFQGEYGVASVPVEFTVVNQAPLGMIATDQQLGSIPMVVNFDASASSDPDGTIVLIEWDLDGDGTYEVAPGTQQVQQTYLNVGSIEVHLRLTDNRGRQTVAHACLGALDWQFYKLNDYANKDLATTAVVDQKPVAVYTEGELVPPNWNKLHAWFAGGTSGSPQDPQDWERHEIFPSAKSVNSNRMVVINGRPYVLLSESESPPSNIISYRLACAKVAAPASAGDWQICDLVTGDLFLDYTYADLIELAGRPAILMYNGLNDAVECWVSKVEVPSSAADWDVSQIEAYSPTTMFLADLLYGGKVLGNPVVAYPAPWANELHYAYANSSHPMASSDWTLCTVDSGASYYIASGMAVCKDKPTILYETGTINCASALTDTPVNPGLWATSSFPELKAIGLYDVVPFDGKPLFLGFKEFYGDYWFYLGCSNVPDSAQEWISGQFAHPISTGDVPTTVFLNSHSGGLTGVFPNKQTAGAEDRESWVGFCPIP